MNKVVYSEVMEDWDVVNRALDVSEGDTVLSIASAGDNVFHSLLHRPAHVLAVDLNPYQIALARLKQACIANLDYLDFLTILGVREGNRLDILHKVSQFESELYDQYHKRIVEKGINAIGELTLFLEFFQSKLNGAIGRNNVLKLFLATDSLEKNNIWEKYWEGNHEAIDILSNLLSEDVISDSFIPKWAFGQMAENPFYRYFLKRMRERLVDRDGKNNYFMHRLFLGTMPEQCLLPYMEEENFLKLKESTARIRWETGNVVDVLEHSRLSFTKINLSNVPDWLSESEFNQIWHSLTSNMKKGTRVFARSFLKFRNLPTEISHAWRHETQDEYACSNDQVGYFSRYDLWVRA